MLIRIYTGKGADAFSLKQLTHAIEEEHFPVKSISSSEIIHTNWEEDTRLLIFPGGRDIPYHEALKGSGNKRIRAFIENGGRYLGICAGAYYGCQSILFEEGSPLEVRQRRELAFFPGEGYGPAYGAHSFQYRLAEGARLAHIYCPAITGYFKPYFNGGCLFRHIEANAASPTILAHYADLPNTPPAIIRCSVGKGYATLCGVHPEYCPKHMQTDDPYIQQLIPLLEQEEVGRRQLFAYLLSSSM